jgi:hypothetical protein
MIDLANILIALLIASSVVFMAWSFLYVIKKARDIRRRTPEAPSVWKMVVLHIIMILVVGATVNMIVPEEKIDVLYECLGWVIMPIYLNRKSRGLTSQEPGH